MSKPHGPGMKATANGAREAARPVAKATGRNTPERAEQAAQLRSIRSRHRKAEAAYKKAVSEQTPRPSNERRAFGTNGRAGANPADVAAYDHSVKQHNRAHRAYLKAAKESTSASNEHFYAMRKIREKRKSR